MDGFILLNKPVGMTSRKACDNIARILKTKKVGHVGTLDPFASGLLIVMVGKATKCLQYFDDLNKAYEATICLGKETSTLDTESEVILEIEVPNLTKEETYVALKSFLGKQKQMLPMTSAAHVNGVRLYEYAHKGIEIDRPFRDIEIYDINLLDLKDNELTFNVAVSKGTYIRVLGNDIAHKLGTVGYLNKLIRTSVGPIDIKETVNLEDINEDSLINISDILSRFCLTKIVDIKTAKDIKDGKILSINDNNDSKYLFIVDEENNPVAMYNKVEERYIFSRGLF